MIKTRKMTIGIAGLVLGGAALYASSAAAVGITCLWESATWTEQLVRTCQSGNEWMTVWAKGWDPSGGNPKWLSVNFSATNIQWFPIQQATVIGVDASGQSISLCFASDNAADGTSTYDLDDCESAVRFRLMAQALQ